MSKRLPFKRADKKNNKINKDSVYNENSILNMDKILQHYMDREDEEEFCISPKDKTKFLERYSYCIKKENKTNCPFKYPKIIRLKLDLRHINGKTNQMTFNDESHEKIKTMLFLTKKETLSTLYSINKKYLQGKFSGDVERDYGVREEFLEDLPNEMPSRKPENYVFLHSDEMLFAFINAPKVPLENWQKRIQGENSTIYTRKLIMNIDGSIILCEETKERTNQVSDKVSGANSGVKLCGYFRGLEEGKFMIERWDFEPGNLHRNKLDENGVVSGTGVKVEKTKYSHAHIYNLRQRLIFTQNCSADIEPTPINKNNNKEEYRYFSFEDMVRDFEESINIYEKMFSKEDLEDYKIKELGFKYLPKFNQKSQKVDYTPEDFWVLKNGRVENSEKVKDKDRKKRKEKNKDKDDWARYNLLDVKEALREIEEERGL